MHVLFIASVPLAREQVMRRLQAEPGIDVTITQTVDEALPLLHDVDVLALYDPAPPHAAQVVATLNRPGCRVRWMHILTAGREKLEKAGLPPQVLVTGATGAAAPVVAEHAMALILGLLRRLPDSMANLAARQWNRDMAARSGTLEGATLAIVGYGHIGTELARRAHGFGAHTIGLSRSARLDEWLQEAQPLSQLHAVLARADVVALTVASTPETRHLIDARALAACKRGALLVNVARGALVDSAALREALASGQLGGAGIDVTDPEPLPPDDPLWTAPNLIVTPHYGGAGSPPSFDRIAESLMGNLRRFVRGEALVGLVPH